MTFRAYTIWYAQHMANLKEYDRMTKEFMAFLKRQQSLGAEMQKIASDHMSELYDDSSKESEHETLKI